MQWSTTWNKQYMLWNQYLDLLFKCFTGQSGLHRLCTAWFDDSAAEVRYEIIIVLKTHDILWLL